MSSGSEIINSDELIKIALIWFFTVSRNTLLPHSIFVFDNGQAGPSPEYCPFFLPLATFI